MSTTGSYDFFAEEASKRVDSCWRSTNFFVGRPETVDGSVAVTGELPRRRVTVREGSCYREAHATGGGSSGCVARAGASGSRSGRPTVTVDRAPAGPPGGTRRGGP